ncbi:MAG TPA: sulfotransferase domain-containing protein [Pirellulaceae bacterium]|nr:sulfotransferase domain-containing protein [Pirellulaceae bacterium]HMO91227.1 sulfotransferase domain-containing protein [Pirellulaceae bacterium]HMP68589.1 sulfotransferase domain-containing protein [Pirellulaceae bacterium]
MNNCKIITVTGVHKSGNSWLNALLFDLFNPNQNTSLSRLFCLHDILYAKSQQTAALNSFPLAQLAERLLAPTPQNRFELQQVPEAALDLLAKTIRWNQARRNREYQELDNIRQLLTEYCFAATHEQEAPEVCFIPSKHMPLQTLRRQFPSFQVIWLIRDPRDALVSYFYHAMGALAEHYLADFIELDGARQSWRLRNNWRAEFIQHRMREQLNYYGRCHDNNAVGRLSGGYEFLIKYEQLLDRTTEILQQLFEWVGRPVDSRRVEAAVEKYRFDKLTGSADEKPDSFVRKGIAGEWRAYFQQADTSLFGQHYLDLLVDLGYENDNDWLRNLPNTATHEFALDRFRPRSSAVYASREIWINDETLQRDYPRPFDFSGEATYFDFLLNCQHETMRAWFEKTGQCFDVNRQIEERRSSADELLGY